MGGSTCAECNVTVLRRGPGWQSLPVLGTRYCPQCVEKLEAEDAERDAAYTCACKACGAPQDPDWVDDSGVCENCQDKACGELEEGAISGDVEWDGTDFAITEWALNHAARYSAEYTEVCVKIEAARCAAIARGYPCGPW